MEIPAASISQVMRLRDGRMAAIDDDVCGVVKQLQEINPALRVRFSEAAELFVVYQILDNGEEHLVTTTPELDGRLVKRIAEIAAPGYDYGAELDRLDKAAKKRQQDEWDEQTQEALEKLSWAIRHDLKKAKPGPMYVPPDAYGG